MKLSVSSIDTFKSCAKKYYYRYIEKVKIDNIKLFYKLIANTRDIVAGKGEYSLTYMMISELYNFSMNVLIIKILNIFFNSSLSVVLVN